MLSLATAMVAMATVDMVATAITDMADTDTMATMARGRLRQLLWLLLSQLLLPSLATDTMADMATVVTEATVATEDMVMDTVMATTARDLRMPPMATVMAMVMVMVMVTVMVMGTDTTDKKEGIVMTSRVQWIHNEMDL